MDEAEFHSGWQAGEDGQPCPFGASADWLAGYLDGQRFVNGVAPRRYYLTGARS